MKILVETTGAFQLVAEDTGDIIRSHGVSVVRPSPWLGERMASNQVENLGKVDDRATNADWDDALKQSDGDRELALAAFLSEFAPGTQADNPSEGAILPRAKVVTGSANESGQTAGLRPDVKPADAGEHEGPGGPKDTNVPAAARHKGK